MWKWMRGDGQLSHSNEGWKWACDKCKFVVLKATRGLATRAAGGHKSYCNGKKEKRNKSRDKKQEKKKDEEREKEMENAGAAGGQLRQTEEGWRWACI